MGTYMMHTTGGAGRFFAPIIPGALVVRLRAQQHAPTSPRASLIGQFHQRQQR